MPEIQIPDLETSIQLAKQTSNAYQNSLIGVNRADRAFVIEKNNQLWQVDVSANITANNRYLPDLEIGNNKSVSVNVSVPIHDLSRKRSLIQAKSTQQTAHFTLQQSNRDIATTIINARNNIDSLKTEIKLGEDSVRWAKKNYRVALTKLKFGQTSQFEASILRDTLTNAEISLITKKISYLDTLADFEAAIGTTLQLWGIEIQEF